MISGLSAALDQGRQLYWGPVLGLCAFVAAAPLSLPAGDEALAERDRLLAQIKIETSSLIRKGMRDDGSGIPHELINEVSGLLQTLISNLPRVGTEQLGGKRRAIAESLISARAGAQEEIIRCAFWARNRGRETGDETTASEGTSGLGELREILELNLDPNVDPDLRLRKVYGEHFPSLAYLDPAWASRNVPVIFPTGEAERRLFDPAWQSYVMFAVHHAPAFDLIREQYGVAIERLGTASADQAYGTDPDRQLAQHIVLNYVWGRSSLDDENSLINMFFTAAGPSLRASAVGFVGESLRGMEGDVDAEILSRLQALWANRFERARRAASVDEYKEEIASFGWWFTSEKFDEEWSLRRLREVLLLVKKVDADDFVIERLAALAPKYPGVAVEWNVLTQFHIRAADEQRRPLRQPVGYLTRIPLFR